MTDLIFTDVDIPVISNTVNPYLIKVRELAGTGKAVAFITPVTDRGPQADYEKIKRDLGDAGARADVTVRSIILDADTRNRLTLPSGKDRQLKIAGDQKQSTVKQLHVTFWTIEKIVQGSATTADDDGDN